MTKPKGWTEQQLPNMPKLEPPEVMGIETWWRTTADEDLGAFAPKLAEYGSNDLELIGQIMSDAAGRDMGDPTEIGLYFYLVGKMARWGEAVKAGRPVSDDTLHDITVYSMMARRNREGGLQ